MSTEQVDVRKQLAKYVLDKMKEKDIAPEQAVAFLKELGTTRDEQEHLAVIGLACRFPDADDPDQFWDNLAAGRNSIKSLPPSRVEDVQRIGSEKTTFMKAGFLEAVDAFDPEYFNLPPKVAVQMDPYHRLMLQVFIEALENAGYHRGQLQGRQIGIFVGNDHTHRLMSSYLSFLPEEDFTVLTGSWTGILASRLSYLLDLNGPAMVIDTSCSSSLVAIDLARKSISDGDCEAALIGGVNLFLIPGQIDGEMQSNDYQVRAFDNEAKGTVWGEGVAAILIKPLSKAVADGDHIYGVIRGIAVNNDGTSNGITAPSAKAQEEVLLKAWKRAQISPETLSYIETHGTGTKLGDPIEIKGITGAFAKHSSKRQFCAIGSIKSNIGHTVGVAGLASLIKVLLSMGERSLPPSINFEQPNALIDFCNSPVYIQDELTEWKPDTTPLRAGISSFSLSGTNCHLVVEEAPVIERKRAELKWNTFVLSARSQDLLRKTALKYRAYLKRHKQLQWSDVCFTSCAGREQQAVRVAILSQDLGSLLNGLDALCTALERGNATAGEVIHGDGYYLFIGSPAKPELKTRQSQDEAERLIGELIEKEHVDPLQHWKRLCTLFVQGVQLNFERLFAGRGFKRCPLPPQVFNNKRYWDETLRESAAVIKAATTAEEALAVTAASLWTEALQAGSCLEPDSVEHGVIERFVAWAWSQILGYSTIHAQDNFYALGGDSVTGLRIIQLLSVAFESEIALSRLMESPGFAEFVQNIKQEYQLEQKKLPPTNGQITAPAHAVVPLPDKLRSAPLSPSQNRIFVFTQLIPDSLAYNIAGVKRLQNYQSADEVERIIFQLIERHESLRTSFQMQGDSPVQIVHPHVPFSIDRRRLNDEEQMEREERVYEELKRFVRPFDINQAPLIRVGYFEFDDRDVYLAIDMHHIITDGASMGLLFAEYEALAAGKKLPHLPVQYIDVVEWGQKRLADPAMQKHRQWWIEQFRDGVPTLNLPTDKTRPAVRTYKGSRVFHTLPKPLLERVRSFTKESGVTMYMVLFAVFHSLLSRLSEERDIVIGTPVSGRSQLAFQNVIGMFVNTLPIRATSTAEESFLDFLAKLKQILTKAYDHQEYPYEAMIEDIKHERNSGRNPLFDVYFVLQNIDIGLTGKNNELMDFDSGAAKFDLTINARETPEGLLMEWEYAEDLYQRSTIVRMAHRYQTLLTSILENPQTCLGDLEIMDDDERRLLLEEWNKTETDFPGHKGIVPLFEEWVAKQGDADALVMDGRRMSYRELNSRSNQVARAILENGVGPGSGVALLLERSFDMIAAILGTLKAGCYYIPLDPSNPQERLISILTDSNAKLLLTHHELYEQCLGDSNEWPVFRLEDLVPHLPDHNLGLEYGGEDLAYIMYTSGTTGLPKGTLIRQKSVIRVVCDAGYVQFDPDDVFLMLSNYSFDGSTFDIFGALLNGARLVLIHSHEVTDPQTLGTRIHENNVSSFFITVSLFNALVDVNIECLDGTKKVFFGGEAASVHHVRRAFERLGPGRLYNGYGPTETTVFAACYPVEHFPDGETLPIGKAIGNTKLYVLDERMNPQPIGVPGELHIGGAGLAVGYLNRPELTEEKFVKDPFRPGERLYRTGDIVMWQEDGVLRYLGRKDEQIKLRGYRIELKEIEMCALRHEAVQEAHAGVYVDENGGRTLSLWIVPRGAVEDFDIHVLRHQLAQQLPSYMVPVFIMPIPAMPLNKNGKVDKFKLPAPRVANEAERREPRNERETLLADVWEQVLGSRPSIIDNFFALGGDSIKAIQMVARIQNAGWSVEMADLFQYQTIETLAPHLKARKAAALEQGEVQGPCQPSLIQEWFLKNTAPEPPGHFTQAMWVRGYGKVEPSVLEKALQRLCAQHDALRLAVSAEGTLYIRGTKEGQLYRVVELPAMVEEEDLSDLLLEAQVHINLQDGPLLVAAVGTGEWEGHLFIAVHHIAVDVVSWGPLLEDLLTLLEHPNASLPPKTTAFSEWTQAVAEWARNGGAKDELPYWREMARTATKYSTPFSQKTVRHRDTIGHTHWIKGETGRILCTEANRAYYTETVHLLLSILTLAWREWAGVPGVLLNLEGHGREAFSSELDVNRTVGWFTSAYPLLLKAEDSLANTIKSVKESVRSVPRRGFGFGSLRSLTPDLSKEDQELLASLHPLVSFNYLGRQQTHEDLEIEVLPAEITIDGNYATEWVLDIVAAQVGEVLRLDIRYPPAAIDEQQFARLVQLLDEAANVVAKHCASRKIGEKTASDYTVTPLSQDELEHILDDLKEIERI